MSYEKRTIQQIIADIDHKKIYLPALQRKFVWDKPQIELLFDSLMRNFPFGTFLFWRLHKQKAENYVFYEFLTEYDSRNPYNRRKTGAFTHSEIIGVLDGQQRLSSMYIGLMGSHTEKTPYKRYWSLDAYPKMELYLNILSLPYEIDADNKIQILEEKNFEFRFIAPSDAAEVVERNISDTSETGTEPMFWMKVGNVLSWEEDPEFDRIIDDFIEKCRSDSQKDAIGKQRRFITKGLSTLHQRIHKDPLINFFEVAKDDLEDILKIFVRVNSGGKPLSKTDLLFSTIVATWDDGREEIENTLKKINAIGDGFNFSNEYLMRCCLVLTDGPVLYKVNSFRAENVQKIRAEWPGIAKAISGTVSLLFEFGFSDSVLTSQNATIPIAYYIYKGGKLDKDSKVGLQKYLIHALLNRLFSTSQDQLFATFRNFLRTEVKDNTGKIRFDGRLTKFSFPDLLSLQLPRQKSLAVTEADIERFLQSSKGADTFFILSLLYPHLRFNEIQFHQDHLHPAADFTDENLEKIGIGAAERESWYALRDTLPNLQLLEGRLNESKNATPLATWMDEMTGAEAKMFAQKNFFPQEIGLNFSDFKQFYSARKELLRMEIRKVLAISKGQPPSEKLEWQQSDEDT